MYNLLAYSDNHSKRSWSLWRYYREKTALIAFGALANFRGNSDSFRYKQKITSSTENNGTKAVKIIAPLKYLSNFWRNFEMSLVNCEINLILTWFTNCLIFWAAADQTTTFAITDTKLYVPVVTWR